MNGREGNETDLDGRLGGLREMVRDLEAGKHVEDALLGAFRSERAAPARRPSAWWPAWALAAAIAVIVTVSLVAWLHREDSQPVPTAAVAPPAPRPEVAVLPEPPPASPRPVVEEFIPLVPDLSWGPGEAAQILRVSMPRAALQSFGLPVDEDRVFETVRADILVGQDMVVRAIRIVR